MRLLAVGRGLFAVAVAMVLSVAIVSPAAAADPWVPPDPKTVTADQIKRTYGIDYWQREWTSVKGAPTSTWDSLQRQISGTVNPSKTTPITRPINTSNIPISGKIIEPGKTILRAPSTYKPSVLLPGAGAFLSRGLLGAGFGMGGTTQPPGNWRAIAQQQGLPSGCYVEGDTSGCSGADMKKVFNITSCNLSNSCTAIGATAPDGTGSPFADWFKDTALPFLDDLWAQITGQKQEDSPSDQHYDVVPNGCLKSLKFEYRAPNNGTLHMTNTDVKPRPASGAANQYAWDTYCSPGTKEALPSAIGLPAGRFETVCLDTATGKTSVDGSVNSFYGVSLGVGTAQWDGTTGQNKVGLCSKTGSTLLAIRFFNNQPQTYYNTNGTAMAALTYFEWVNPDPTLNSIESTKITTSWDCRAADGTVLTYTKSVTKIAAAVEPACPLGSELIRHDIKSTDGGSGATRTIDSGGEVAGSAAKYPLCLGGLSQGCTMDIYVDGQKCTAIRIECQTWPQVNSNTPSRITCRWGTYTMPTSDCFGLSNGYKTETGSVFDPHSGTWVGTDIWGNPVAPNPEPWNPVNPAPVAGTAPSTAPTTGTTTPGGSTAPTEGTNPATVPGEAGKNCLASGWSWNPVSWVMVPTQCALQWAFVPPQARVDAAAAVLKPKLEARGLQPFIDPFLAPFASFGGGGCKGPGIDLSSIHLDRTLYPFDACSAPMSNIAQGVYSFFALSIVIQGGMSCIRGVAAAFGFNWGLGTKEDA